MRYADLAPPKPYARKARHGEAALVVRPESIQDLLALLDERPDYVLIERAQPATDLPVLHYIRCSSALDVERLERAWLDYAFKAWEYRCAQSPP